MPTDRLTVAQAAPIDATVERLILGDVEETEDAVILSAQDSSDLDVPLVEQADYLLIEPSTDQIYVSSFY